MLPFLDTLNGLFDEVRRKQPKADVPNDREPSTDDFARLLQKVSSNKSCSQVRPPVVRALQLRTVAHRNLLFGGCGPFQASNT